MKALREALRFGMTLALALLAAIALGTLLDDRLHTAPLCLILLILYAVFGSIWRLYRRMEEDG